MTVETVRSLLERALDGYGSLASLGEEVEDEWTYVNDLSGAWRGRLLEVAAERGDEPVDPAAVAAVDELLDEIGRIEDAHRAIDWLSTCPQIILLALGEHS